MLTYYYFLGRRSYHMLPHEAMAWAIAVENWWYWRDSVPYWFDIGFIPDHKRFRTLSARSSIG